MLDWLAQNITVPASFASVATNVSAGVEYGQGVYEQVSPAYSSFLIARYGQQIMQSQGKNLTAMGNFALTILALPDVQANLTKAIQAPTGFDESLIQAYLTGAVTCLSVAATVLPMVSSYLSPTKETQQSVDKIKESVKQIEGALKQQKTQEKIQEKTPQQPPKKASDDNRKKILTQYPQTQTKKMNPHKRQHKHKHSKPKQR